MLSLFFPNPDALRLALASGIVPDDVARDGVSAAPGEPSGLWIQSGATLDKPSLAALAHIGVRPFARPAELPSQAFPCWAAALPLKRLDVEPADGPVLFELPAVRLAGFLTELARCGSTIDGYRFADGMALVRLAVAPRYWIERTRDGADDAIASYCRAAPNFWVQSGWQHLLPPEGDADEPQTILVSAAKGWRILEPGVWHEPREVLALPLCPTSLSPETTLKPFDVPIRLKRRADAAEESFWVFPGDLDRIRPYLYSADHRALMKLSAALIRCPIAGECIALRPPADRRGFAPFLGPFRSFAPHPTLKSLMIPVDLELAPALRSSALESALELKPTELTWIETTGDGVRANRVPLAAFRPLADWLRYSVPEVRLLRIAAPKVQTFAFSGFVVIPEPILPTPLFVPPLGKPVEPAARSAGESARARLAKWAGKIFSKSKTTGESETPSDVEGDGIDFAPDAPRRTALSRRERIARRAELEESLFQQDSPDRVGERWAELGELYAEGGNPTDATLCWLHAVWSTPHPPESWLQPWAKLEARPGKVIEGDPRALRADLVDWIRLALQPTSQLRSPSTDEMKSTLAKLETGEENLPCRMVWLARWACAHLSGGDVLLLARGRDRLFARLQHETALAAHDTPSFLRFRGLAGSDRFPLARDWLLRCREPIHRWLKKQGKANRLTWAGLDADIPCTLAYADLMLAWGFAKLGDLSRTGELAAAAELALDAASANSADTQVHRRLFDLFKREIDSAIRTRNEGADEPRGSGSEPAPLAGYAVAKLVSHSQILNRAACRSEFGAGPLSALLGDDELGAKLLVLLERTSPPDESALRALLEIVDSDRTAATLPRVVLTLLEIAETPELVADLLPLGPRALELLPEALRLRGIEEGEGSNYLIRLSGRCIEVLCRAAIAYGDPESLRSLVRTLSRGLDADDAPTREILLRTASRVFRALSRSGLTSELRLLLGRWYAIGENRVEANLSAAIGWFTLGEAERGNRILNDARERLFVEGIADERERTRTALAYAQALAHAPPRLALGRLEELFQRLGSISTDGAAARYYALKPLELIDAAITAIVNEDFSLGPEVRNWLDEDEQRIRSRITRDLELAMKALRAS